MIFNPFPFTKKSDDILYKPRRYAIEKDESGKYNFSDSLSLKTKGYQWCVKNSCGEGGKVLKVKHLESKYLVSRDFNLGAVTGLWAVTSSLMSQDYKIGQGKDFLIELVLLLQLLMVISI